MIRRLVPVAAFAAAATLAAVVAPPAVAQSPQLGTVSFPTSAEGEAQEQFLLGVRYLHSFEYASAARAFRHAQELDPDFALAYWGEAMTYNHPLWGEWDRDAALAALRRLAPSPEERRAQAPTRREKMYLDAVEALWAEGPKPARDTAYAAAMERLVRAFPYDLEARAFHALSLLGLSGTTRVFRNYMQAAAVAAEVFRENPDHPGAAHYLIHAFDDPIHAPLGLPAARAYSRIAPDAAHAQHMTTHIFLALGMWDEVVSQNAIAADLTGWGPGHYTAWLGYGLLQGGKHDAARDHLERAWREMSPDPSPRQRAYLTSMRAHYVLNTGRWDDPVLEREIDLGGTFALPRAMDAFTLGYAALGRRDGAAARARLDAMRALKTEREEGREGAAATADARIRVMQLVLEGALAHHAGRGDTAVRLLREAAEIEEGLPLEFGPPDIVKPSHELLGEVLLALGRPDEARTAFEGALALAPGRAPSLLGLLRAADAAGDEKTAARARDRLRTVWHDAEPGIPGLEEIARGTSEAP